MIQAETRAFLSVIGLFMEQKLFYFLITDKFISGIKKPPGIIPDGVKLTALFYLLVMRLRFGRYLRLKTRLSLKA